MVPISQFGESHCMTVCLLIQKFVIVALTSWATLALTLQQLAPTHCQLWLHVDYDSDSNSMMVALSMTTLTPWRL